MRVGSAVDPTSALTGSLDELLGHIDWFIDPLRPAPKENVPPVVVVDDFYTDPNAIRRLALSWRFVSYVPPDAAVVGAEIAALNAHRRGSWRSTAFVTYHGQVAEQPYYGERYNPDGLRAQLQELLGERILERSWPHAGDYWNGAFHLVENDYDVGEGFIHHHYKAGDLEGRGWSGVIYLSPHAPATAGTSIWRNRRTGRCVASFGDDYDSDPSNFELAYVIENRFNRAVLFRENIWHRLEHGFGIGAEARLTQTLFFDVGDAGADWRTNPAI